MKRDIATQLRKAVAQAVEADTEPFPDFSKLLWEAADEIERLRIIVERLTLLPSDETLGTK